MENIAIYCINLESSELRLRRMQERFTITGLININFIKAKTPETAQEYGKDMDKGYIGTHYPDMSYFMKDVACYASHMLALKTFVESDNECCLICEDDILFHNNFLGLLNDTIVNSNDAKLISLSYMLSGPIDQTYYWKDSDGPVIKKEVWDVKTQKKIRRIFGQKYNVKELKVIKNKDDICCGLWKMDHQNVWGAQYYYITRNYVWNILIILLGIYLKT